MLGRIMTIITDPLMLLFPALTFNNLTLPPFKSNKETLFRSFRIGFKIYRNWLPHI